MDTRKPYPSDVSDEEWAFVAPYLALVRKDAPQREHDLREVFNGLRWVVRTGSPWRYMPHDLPPWEAIYQQTRRWLKAGVFEEMVHDLRVLLRISEGRAPEPTAAILDSHNEQDRGRVGELAEAVQEATGESVELAYVDQGYTGEKAAEEAEAFGMRLEVVRHEEAKRGFVLLPRRWVVERDFAWASRFRRLAKDYERLPATLAGLHFVVFACLFLQQAIGILTTGS
jgi:transposase